MSRILCVYIEPAPYILDFLAAWGASGTTTPTARFLSVGATQPWKLGEQLSSQVVPGTRRQQCLALFREICSGKYVGVHLAGWGHPVLAMTGFLARMMRLPVFIESDTPWRPGGGRFKHHLRTLVYRLLFRLVSGFFPGGARPDDYLASFGVPAGRRHVARMTISLRASPEDVVQWGRRLGLPADAQIAVFVGRLVPEKGIHDLLAAFAIAAAQCPTLHLLIVGDGVLRADVEAACASHDRIVYAGWQECDAAQAILANGTFLVLPSLVEPWGLVVNEAMALGLPVLASDAVGCTDDLVTDGWNGYRFPTGDVQKLADRMLRLASEREMAKRMGQNSELRFSDWTMAGEASRVNIAWANHLSQGNVK